MESELQCGVCSKYFTTAFNLSRHQKKKNPCSTINPLQCQVCLKVFTCKFNIQRHQNKRIPCVSQELLVKQAEIELEKLKINRVNREIDKVNREIKLLKLTATPAVHIQILNNNCTFNINSFNPTDNITFTEEEAKNIRDSSTSEELNEKLLRARYTSTHRPQDRVIMCPDKDKDDLYMYEDNKWVHRTLTDKRYSIIDGYQYVFMQNRETLSPPPREDFYCITFSSIQDNTIKEVLNENSYMLEEVEL